MACVALQNLCKTFPGPKGMEVHALRNVNLTVADKEFVVLVGPSGCGKTTSLRVIAGLEEATSGAVLIDRVEVNRLAPKDRDVAMVFQNYALYPHLTVFENMAFGLRLRRFEKSEIERRVAQAAELLELGPLLQRKPKTLSGGQRQRVAVGRAIVRKPKVFLFDEPLSNLDARMRVQMRAELSRLHHQLEATMIYVTHDQAEAMTMGDRIVVMRDGCVQQVARPLEVYRQPANLFVAGFMGSPPMNILRGALVRHGPADGLWFEELLDGGTPAPGSIRAKLTPEQSAGLSGYAGKPIALGVRAEDLQIADGVEGAATVELVETLGAETCLHLKTSAHTVIARVPASSEATIGQRLGLGLDIGQARFFDVTTEARVG